MYVITLALMPRLKSTLKSYARHFLCKAFLLLFVQIQNVPEIHRDTQMQIHAVRIKYGNYSIRKSKYSALGNYIVTVLLVTVLSPW